MLLWRWQKLSWHWLTVGVARLGFTGERRGGLWLGLSVHCDWGGALCGELSVPVPDEPEPGVRHLDAPEARLLQVPVDSSELVPETLVCEHQSESGSNTPNICRRGIQEFVTQGPFELEN